ncbi:MAG: hypothetical protein M3Q55_09275 [Acidobacteriota bacterium]|nr:hypothetical protein [Acidobacteriota bacterium]
MRRVAISARVAQDYEQTAFDILADPAPYPGDRRQVRARAFQDAAAWSWITAICALIEP